MIIGINFNNVLFPMLQTAVQIHNKETGSSVDFSQLTKHNLYECLDISTATNLEGLCDTVKVYANMKPHDGAIDALKKLVTDGHDVFIFSNARGATFMRQSALVECYFPFIPQENIMRMCKSNLLKADVMIDDSIDRLKLCMCDRVVFDCPYNQNERLDYVYGLVRFSNWDDVVEVINKLK